MMIRAIDLPGFTVGQMVDADSDALTKPLGAVGVYTVTGLADHRFRVTLTGSETAMHVLRTAAIEHRRRWPNGEDHVFFEIVTINRRTRQIVLKMGS